MLVVIGLVGFMLGYVLGVMLSESEINDKVRDEHQAMKNLLKVYSSSGYSSTYISDVDVVKIKNDYTYYMLKFNLRRQMDLREDYEHGLIGFNEYTEKLEYHQGLINEM